MFAQRRRHSRLLWGVVDTFPPPVEGAVCEARKANQNVQRQQGVFADDEKPQPNIPETDDADEQVDITPDTQVSPVLVLNNLFTNLEAEII
jgi:hypothetical protein